MRHGKIIIDLCGGTGAWSKPYKDAGYHVINVTLPEYDVRLYKPPKNVYGVLAAPPCTHLAGSGARWWKEKGESALLEALSIVDACIRIIYITAPKFWCLENPVGRLVHYLGKPEMYFNPCDYGDPWTKKTCLWGHFNRPLRNPIEPEFVTYKGGKRFAPNYGHHKDAAVRSITPQGFAKAFFEANQ